MAKATKDQLRRMIMQFRISELQALLDYAGEKSPPGRKKELQKRCISLISARRTVLISNKVTELYKNKKRHRSQKAASSKDTKDSNYYPNIREKNRYFQGFNAWQNNRFSQNFSSALNRNFSNTLNDVTDSSSSDSNSDDGCQNNRIEMIKNISESITTDHLHDIKFKKLPFFEHCTDITTVVPLVPKKHEDDTFHCNVPFLVRRDTVKTLGDTQSPYQIQVRICILNNEVEVSDALPLALWIKVNEKYCTLPPPIPSTNRQGMLLKRMNVPINITDEVDRISTYNIMAVSWSSECEELYGLIVHLVRKYSADELIANLQEKGERDPAVTKKKIYDNLNDEDNEIAATSLKMSLICPLGKILISLPVRGSTCNHLQCFDGTLYIKMNDVKSTWLCPVCNQPCLYENLFVDGYFAGILRDKTALGNATEVQLTADGSWEPAVSAREKSTESARLPTPVKKPEPEPVHESAIQKIDIDLVSDDSNIDGDITNELEDFYCRFNKDRNYDKYDPYKEYGSEANSLYNRPTFEYTAKNPMSPSYQPNSPPLYSSILYTPSSSPPLHPRTMASSYSSNQPQYAPSTALFSSNLRPSGTMWPPDYHNIFGKTPESSSAFYQPEEYRPSSTMFSVASPEPSNYALAPIEPTFPRVKLSDSDPSVLSTSSGSNNSSPGIPTKDVMLVDLTFSDSDSDSVSGSLVCESVCKREIGHQNYDDENIDSPPVYDISDSDCGEL